ncbi:MAG: DsbA family protein [Nanoarchaeota archaeon]|nr:DsbA family protein [Nanoarchaeota archaeon]
MKNKKWVTILIIITVIVISILILMDSSEKIDKKTTICIGENSRLYVQLGCHACETQEEMFGEHYKFLTTIDCFFERETCGNAGILKTPTWIIQGEIHEGVQSIEELKELTGC